MSQGSMSDIDSLLQSLGVAKPIAAPARPTVAEIATRMRTPASTSASRTSTASHAPAQPVSSQHQFATQNQFKSIPIQGNGHNTFVPKSPLNLEEAGLQYSESMDLILKLLLGRGVESGFNISQLLGLKFPIIENMLRQMKVDRLATYKNSIAGGDYLYELTDLGRERAKALSEICSYYGTAPVPLSQYVASVKAQSIDGRKPSLADIRKAFADLDIGDEMLSNVGQAIHSGRGMFLYGSPGNGKTSMAERVTKSFGDTIWIPKAIVAAGEIIRMFDPNRHKPVEVSEGAEDIDGRWVCVERPTIVAGGELRMDNLEITYIRKSGIGEAPLQLKANCGTLLIDDFGRQKMSTDELLNRWIVPLEQRHDFLHLESGRTIQIPFDQLIIFSTNLEPRDLADDAFLRRIPYKIEVKDPSEADFRKLMIKIIQKEGFRCEMNVIDHLIDNHYVAAQRAFRFCHPRDLIRQIENRCTLHNYPKEVTIEAIDQAVGNYFNIM